MPEKQQLEALMRVNLLVPVDTVDVLGEPKDEAEASAVAEQRAAAAVAAETVYADKVRAAVENAGIGTVDSILIEEVR